MVQEAQAHQPEYDRLKEINSELSEIAHHRKECRGKTNIFAVLGSIVLAASVLGLIQTVISEDDDWSANPNSPVHSIVSEDKSSTEIIVPISVTGILIGLGLFARVRSKTCQCNDLDQKSQGLVEEMRTLRDQMYPREAEKRDMRYAPPKHAPEHPLPMDPDEVRGEYAGVYSPPGSHRTPTDQS